MNTPRGVWLDDLTRQEAVSRFDGDCVVIIPVASGGDRLPAHLPLKSPAVIVRALAQKLVERLDLVMLPVIEAEGPAVSARVEKLQRLGLRRLALLDLRLWAGPSLDVSGDVLRLPVCDRADADEFGTSCLMALDPRSVRMPLLPAGSRAEAFRGERGLAVEVDAIVETLVAKWSDLAR
jgi:hypothetical protein